MPPKEKKSLKKKSSSVASDSGKEKKGKSKKDKKDKGDKDKKDTGGGSGKKSKKGNKGDGDKKKGKKGDKDKAKQRKQDEEELLEAPPDIGVLGRFLERYCCCRSAAKVAFEEKQREERERKAAEEEAARAAEEAAREITRGDIPIRELRKYIREFNKDFEAEFWPPLMQRAVDTRVQHAAATRIQTLVRAFLGPCRRMRLEMTAFSHCDKFWERKRAEKLHAKDLAKIEVATRASFASSYARNTFNAVVSHKARSDAAFLCQRAWRGFVGRSIFKYFMMLARELREKKEKPPKSRFSSEVFQRVWGRKNYQPKGGWPGKADYIQYDMWEHKDKPPKGNDFGLLTHKIHAAPKTEKELRLLMSDKNAWVGIPIAVVPSEEVRKEPPIRVQAMKGTSPFNVHVVRKDKKATQPKRLTGLQTLKALGWRNPLTDKAAATKDNAHVVGLAGGKGSGMIPPKKQDTAPVNRHRLHVQQAQEVHPRHVAIKQVLKVPPSPEDAGLSSLDESGGVDLNSAVFHTSASYQPYYPGQSGLQNNSSLHNNNNSFDESFVNTELNNMSSFEERGFTADSQMEHGHSESRHALGAGSSALGGRQDKMKPDGPRLSTLRHDEIPPTERGARKAPMGRPLRLGGATVELAQGHRSIAQVAREQERSLLHMNHHEHLHAPTRRNAKTGPKGSSGGPSQLNKSVSFLTVPDNEDFQGSNTLPPGDFSTTNSQQVLGNDSGGGSAWQKIRDDVSSMTGSKKKFMKSLGLKKKTVVSAEERKKRLENRPRPWPVKPAHQLHLKYSWVSQTMLQRAAQEVHAEDPQLAEERRAAEQRAREEKKKKVPPLARLSQYNDDDPTVLTSLSDLHAFKTKTALSIRDERCRAQAMQHPYHWL
mmetsp:Transcript_18281/g.34183  ORF Transcript_18281/g.34183 Transcript_18281/m.34183 type:complete len:879 (+) Transcript_18281:206-2842(+)